MPPPQAQDKATAGVRPPTIDQLRRLELAREALRWFELGLGRHVPERYHQPVADLLEDMNVERWGSAA